MRTFKVGQKVRVEGFKEPATIIKLDGEGKPDIVRIGTELLRITSEVVTILGVLRTIIEIIITTFRKK